VIEWTNGKLLEVTALARNTANVAVVVVLVMTYYKARAIVPVIVGAIVAGVFLWTINHPEWWQERVGDETTAPVMDEDHVVVMDLPPPLVGEWRPAGPPQVA
jgi:hypothetical protein